MNIILFGAPGVGKGTQAQFLISKFNLAHISTGDILRVAIKNETPLGLEAKKFMDAGNLVPDSVMIEMVREVLSNEKCANGFILDGFPRTVAQADALKSLFVDLKIQHPLVINIDLDENEIVKRLSNRFICRDCGKVFNSQMLKNNKCISCGGEIYQRIDDKPETVRKRLEVYKSNTEPLKNFYSSLNVLKNVDGFGNVDEVAKRIFDLLK